MKAQQIAPDQNRWRILALLGFIQFMLILDATIVTVALPPIKADLGFTQEGLSWVLNGYVITAGGFLLLGGRLADMFGRRRIFLLGVYTFGIGSLGCVIAWNPAVLVGARFIQGFGEAFAGPAALGIIALKFTDPLERVRALSIWGALAGLGGGTGSLISGIITGFASWHWLFAINLPIVALVLWGTYKYISDTAERTSHSLDIAGSATSVAAMVLGIYGVLQAVHAPLTDASVHLPILGSLILVLAFVVIERVVKEPLIPRGFFSDNVRLATNILAVFAAAAFAAYPFTLTLFAQDVVGYTPLQVGFMMLPFVGAIGGGVALGSRYLKTHSIRTLALGASLVAAVGLLLTSLLTAKSTFYWPILPGMITFGLAIGIAMPTFTNGALHRTTEENSSLASAVQTFSHQIGSATGLAVLAAIATVISLRFQSAGSDLPTAATAGFAIALRVAAGIIVVGAAVAYFILPDVIIGKRSPVPELLDAQDSGEPEPA